MSETKPNIDIPSLSENVINSLPFGVYVVDTDRKITIWNRKAEEITGYLREEVLGLYCHSNVLCHINKDASPLCLTSCPMSATIADGQSREAEVFLRHKNHHRISVQVHSTPIYENGEIIGAVEVFYRNRPEYYSNDLVESLTKLIVTDKLTGLYNRRHCENMIESKLQQVRYLEQSYGLLFIDLDNFSRYNNVYGHEVGDQILKTVAHYFGSCVTNENTIFRWGGEEFIGLFDLQYPGEVAVIAEKLRKMLETTEIIVREARIYITASIGATVLQAGDTAETVVARSDRLMYQSKQEGKNKVTVG